MRGKKSYLIPAIVLILIAGTLFFRPRHFSGQAITLRCSFSPQNQGIPLFWVTNHTDNFLRITLVGIETLNAGSWVLISNEAFPVELRLPTTNFGSWHAPLLNPHEADYTTLPGVNLSPPSNCVWRLKARVDELLSGSTFPQALRLLQSRVRTGNTNIPVINPFSRKPVGFLRHSDAVSEPISP